MRTLRQLKVKDLAQPYWARKWRWWVQTQGMGSKALPYSHCPNLIDFHFGTRDD